MITFKAIDDTIDFYCKDVRVCYICPDVIKLLPHYTKYNDILYKNVWFVAAEIYRGSKFMWLTNKFAIEMLTNEQRIIKEIIK